MRKVLNTIGTVLLVAAGLVFLYRHFFTIGESIGPAGCNIECRRALIEDFKDLFSDLVDDVYSENRAMTISEKLWQKPLYEEIHFEYHSEVEDDYGLITTIPFLILNFPPGDSLQFEFGTLTTQEGTMESYLRELGFEKIILFDLTTGEKDTVLTNCQNDIFARSYEFD